MSADEVRFAEFVVDFGRRELRRDGRAVDLQNIPFELLTLLLMKRGQILTRKEIVEVIWGKGHFVDAEHGINTAMRKLRHVLEDDPEHPRFIQTVVGKGYRFVGPTEGLAGSRDRRDKRKQALRQIIVKTRWGIVAGAVAVAGFVLLFVAMRFFTTPPAARATAGGRTGVRALAVLPVRDLSSNPGQGYFADGLTDQLISDLAQAPGLRVISYTSVMRFQNTNEPVRQIARQLGVDAVLEGTAESAGTRVRVTLQLIRAAPEAYLWTGSYIETQGNALTIQDRVASDATREIWSRIGEGRASLTAQSSKILPESYLDYLQGRSYLQRWTPTGRKLAVERFQQALKIDPRNAFAYVGIAEAYASKAGSSLDKGALAETRMSALRAIALNDRLSEAHTALGMIEWLDEWRWKDGVSELRRGVELNPNSAVAHHLYSQILMAEGKTAQGLAQAQEYVKLDPVSPSAHLNLAVAEVLARQYDRAVIEGKKAVNFDPNYAAAHAVLGWAYDLRGMQAKALRELHVAVLLGNDAASKAYLARACFEAGSAAEGQKLLEDVTHSGKAPYETAEVYVALGRYSKAFQWLRKAVQVHDRDLTTYVKLDPWLDPIRSDPRFAGILQRVGLR